MFEGYAEMMGQYLHLWKSAERISESRPQLATLRPQEFKCLIGQRNIRRTAFQRLDCILQRLLELEVLVPGGV